MSFYGKAENECRSLPALIKRLPASRAMRFPYFLSAGAYECDPKSLAQSRYRVRLFSYSLLARFSPLDRSL
jgi:hypothetical protein